MKACQEGVVDGWAKLATSKDRLAALVALVNKKLVAAGVPPREGRLRHEPGEPRQLDFTTWTMLVGQGPLGRESLSEAEAKDLADTVYHEARHTEQWFNMAQLRAGQGLSAKALGASGSERGEQGRRYSGARPLPKGVRRLPEPARGERRLGDRPLRSRGRHQRNS